MPINVGQNSIHMQNNLNKSDTFCVLPWLGISTNPTGMCRLCCIMSGDDNSRKMLKKDTAELFNLGTDNIDDIKNAENAKSVRLDLLAGKKIPECERCWTRETHGAGSRRITSNKRFKHRLTEADARAITAEDGSIDINPTYWDLRFGNLCNLKCIMCNAASSTQWYADHVALTNTMYYEDNGQIVHLKKVGDRYTDAEEHNWWDDELFWKNIEAKIPFLEQVSLIGGEPTLIEQHYVFLQQIVDAGWANKITLEYDTNLTAVHTRALDLWTHFKRVIFRVSIDDFAEQNDYIRFPSKWRIIAGNLEKIKTLNRKNIEISISVTWQIINTYTVLNLLTYLDFPFHVKILKYPYHYNVDILPASIKSELIKIYSAWQTENPTKAQYVNHLIRYLQEMMDTENVHEVRNFCEYSDKLDKLRDTDWKITFPVLSSRITII